MSTAVRIGISIDPAFKQRVSALWLRKILRAAMLAACAPPSAEVSIVLTGDEEIRRLNHLYRGEDHTTDVLSFPLSDNSEPAAEFVVPNDHHLGDIAISYPQALRQAQQHGNTVRQELALLAIHGTLHLMGYDHERALEANEMRTKETQLMSQLGDLVR